MLSLFYTLPKPVSAPITQTLSPEQKSLFDDLPDEIILNIFKLCAPTQTYDPRLAKEHLLTLGKLMLINRRFYSIAHDRTLWDPNLLFLKNFKRSIQKRSHCTIEERWKFGMPSQVYMEGSYLLLYNSLEQCVAYDLLTGQKILDIPIPKTAYRTLKKLGEGCFSVTHYSGMYSFIDLKHRLVIDITAPKQDLVGLYQDNLVLANHTSIDFYDPQKKEIVRTDHFQKRLYQPSLSHEKLSYFEKGDEVNFLVVYSLRSQKEILRQKFHWTISQLYHANQNHALLKLERIIDGARHYALVRIDYETQEIFFMKSSPRQFHLTSLTSKYLLIEELTEDNSVSYDVYNLEIGSHIASAKGNYHTSLYEHYLIYIMPDPELYNKQIFVIFDLEKEDFVSVEHFEGISLAFSEEEINSDVIVLRQIKGQHQPYCAYFYHIPTGMHLDTQTDLNDEAHVMMDRKIARVKCKLNSYEIVVDDFLPKC